APVARVLPALVLLARRLPRADGSAPPAACALCARHPACPGGARGPGAAAAVAPEKPPSGTRRVHRRIADVGRGGILLRPPGLHAGAVLAGSQPSGRIRAPRDRDG